jgi:DivIVA domain-containing protein
MPFTPDEIEIKEFVPTLRGYGREEVRAYLRSVSEDVRRLEIQLEEAKSAVASTPQAQAPGVQEATAPGTFISPHDLGIVSDLKGRFRNSRKPSTAWERNQPRCCR